MTEKEKFISQILGLVKVPIAGQNPIVPTEQQIADLQSTETLQDAISLANNYGWGEFVDQWAISQDSSQQDTVAQALNLALQGNQTNYLGVDANTVINYGGVETTIGKFGENFYVDGDQNAMEALMPDEIREIQANLINAGLLGSKVNRTFRPGVWGVNDRKAMYEIMSIANQDGQGKAEKGWETILQVYLDNPIQTPSQVASYLPPDYSLFSFSF